MLTDAVPEAGRLTMMGEPWIVHVLPSGLTGPAKSTLRGEGLAPAVVGSVTMMLAPCARGDELVSEIVPAGAGCARTIMGTGLESAGTRPGFSI